MQHLCAVMILDGTVSFRSSHDEKRMKDSRVLNLRKLVTLLGDDELTKAMPSRQGIVEVFLRGERKLRHHMKAVRGTAENPMTREEVDVKGYDLMAPVLGRDRARRLCEAIWNLERLKDVRQLRPLLKEKR
jgi:2-methylcitrate dehydratase PrpD